MEIRRRRDGDEEEEEKAEEERGGEWLCFIIFPDKAVHNSASK